MTFNDSIQISIKQGITNSALPMRDSLSLLSNTEKKVHLPEPYSKSSMQSGWYCVLLSLLHIYIDLELDQNDVTMGPVATCNFI